MKLAEKIDPRTEASARALGYYGRLPMPESWEESQEQAARAARRYFWFPAEALDEVPQTLDEMAYHQRHGRLRILSLETRFLWALAVGQAETMRKEADAFASVTRGLFRRKLAAVGFHGPTYAPAMEEALRAFLKGRRVEVSNPLNAPSRLTVEGRVIAHGPLAYLEGTADDRESVHGSHPGVV